GPMQPTQRSVSSIRTLPRLQREAASSLRGSRTSPTAPTALRGGDRRHNSERDNDHEGRDAPHVLLPNSAGHYPRYAFPSQSEAPAYHNRNRRRPIGRSHRQRVIRYLHYHADVGLRGAIVLHNAHSTSCKRGGGQEATRVAAIATLICMGG